jgi:hemerythrin-like domain-containing protein
VIFAGLEHDHVEAERPGERLRRAVEEFRSGAAGPGEARRLAQEFAAHYRRHIAAEDETLMELVRNRLSEEERRQAAGEMRARRTPQAHTRSADPAPESRP